MSSYDDLIDNDYDVDVDEDDFDTSLRDVLQDLVQAMNREQQAPYIHTKSATSILNHLFNFEHPPYTHDCAFRLAHVEVYESLQLGSPLNFEDVYLRTLLEVELYLISLELDTMGSFELSTAYQSMGAEPLVSDAAVFGIEIGRAYSAKRREKLLDEYRKKCEEIGHAVNEDLIEKNDLVGDSELRKQMVFTSLYELLESADGEVWAKYIGDKKTASKKRKYVPI